MRIVHDDPVKAEISVAVKPRAASHHVKRGHQCSSMKKGTVSIGISRIEAMQALIQLPCVGPYVV
jgi:hypothetical protein